MQDKELEAQQRLRDYITHKGLGITEFQNKAGIANNFVRTFGGRMRNTTKAAIRNTFPDLNIEWVETGKGEMFLPTIDVTPNVHGAHINESVEKITEIGDDPLALQLRLKLKEAECNSLQKKVCRLNDEIEALHEQIRILQSVINSKVS